MELTFLIYPILLILIFLAVRFQWVHKMMPQFSKKGWDKVGHLGLYFTMTTILAFLLKDFNIPVKFLFFPMCVAAIIHEIRHYYKPDRNFEFMDMAANFMGILMSYFFVEMFF